MGIKAISLKKLIICLASSGVCYALALADPPPPAKKTVSQFAQDALRTAADELGSAAEEKKILEAEVLVEPMPFVSNYRAAAEGTEIQVDKEKLKNYLRFFPSLFVTTNGVCVKVRAAADCSPCEALRAVVEQGLIVRMERRNFAARVGPALPEESALVGEQAFEDYAARAQEARCDGVIYSEIRPERSSDADDEGADVLVRASAFLVFKDAAGKKVRSRGSAVIQVPKQLAAAQAQSKQYLIPTVARQTADLFANAAAQATTGSRADAEERYLLLEGVQSFAVYTKFKKTVSQAMPDLKIEERIISPGLFQFAVAGTVPLADLVKALKQLSWEGQTLEVVRSSPQEVAVVLK